jgi:hypothetical protein
MIVFFASIAHVYLSKILAKSKELKLSHSSAFEILSKHNTIVYEDKNFHIPAIPIPAIRKIYEAFKVEIPKKIDIK